MGSSLQTKGQEITMHTALPNTALKAQQLPPNYLATCSSHQVQVTAVVQQHACMHKLTGQPTDEFSIFSPFRDMVESNAAVRAM